MKSLSLLGDMGDSRIGTREADENSSSIAKLGRSKQEPGTAAVHATKNKGHDTWSTRIQTCSRSEPPVSLLSAIKIFEKRTFISDHQRTFIQNYPYFTCSQPVCYNYLGIIQSSMLYQQNTCSQESRCIVDLPLPPVSLSSAIKIFEKCTFISDYQRTFIHNSPQFTYSQPVSYHYLGIMRNCIRYQQNTCRQDTCSQESRPEVHLPLSPVSPLSALKIFEKKYIHISSANVPSYRILVFTYLQLVSYHYLGNMQSSHYLGNRRFVHNQ